MGCSTAIENLWITSGDPAWGRLNKSRNDTARPCGFFMTRTLARTSSARFGSRKMPRQRRGIVARAFIGCRGRIRTSTGQLAVAQCSGGQPQSEPMLVGAGITLCLSWIPTPETRGHVCQISSLHSMSLNSRQAYLKQN
jgi:hypothetical protein